MLAVIVCSLVNGVMLIGLVAEIVVGFWRGRTAVADALAFDALVRPAAQRPARLRLA